MSKTKEMPKQNETVVDGLPDKAQNALLSNAISCALEIEMAFKLFSYRISDKNAMLARMDELCTTYLDAKKSIITKNER